MAPIAGRAYSTLEHLGGDAVVVDTGGTTFDVGLVRAGRVAYTRETWLGEIYTGHLLGMGSIDVRSIGAGGGSIAWVDAGGLLRVGPQSAGACPGPACYAQGGGEPTVTDAALVLGYLNPGHFLGGRMPLDVDAARAVLAPLATRLGRALEDTAHAVLTIANESMIKAIHEITVKEGIAPADSVLVAGGGAAGLNIVPIARALGMRRVLAPRTAGALSACGAHFSDIVREFSANHYTTTANFDYAGVNTTLASLDAELDAFAAILRARGLDTFTRSMRVEARYAGQIWELELTLRAPRIADETALATLLDDFHEEHERIFAVRDPGNAVECVHWHAHIAAHPPVVSSSRMLGGALPRCSRARAGRRSSVSSTHKPTIWRCTTATISCPATY